MARSTALGVLALLSGATWVTSADPSECSADRCEEGSDSNILMQKRVEVYDEKIISEDQKYTEDQMQSGAFDITSVSEDELFAEDQVRADAYDIKDFEKVDAEVEEMVRSGKRPEIQNMKKVKTMVQAMDKELIAVHKAAQEELFSLSNGTQAKPMSASKTNRNALQAQQNIKSTIEVQVVGAKANHSSCRAAEAPLNASKIEHCTRLTKFASEITLPAAMPTSKSPALMGPYVKAMSDYYVTKSSKCTEATKGQDCCETQHDIFVKLDSKCTEATKAYDAKRKECNAYQTRYEADFCEWKTKLTDECARYLDPTTGTYANAVKAYDVKEAATKALAGTKEEQQQGTSTWKTEYAGIKKILCYVDVWMNDNNANTVDKTQLQACKKTVDTSPMDITYPGVACSVACSTTPVEKHPGTQGFAAEYAKLAQKVDAVMPCLKDVARGLPGGPAPVAPAPAPELPVGFPSPSPFPGELPPLTLYDQSDQAEEGDETSGTEAMSQSSKAPTCTNPGPLPLTGMTCQTDNGQAGSNAHWRSSNNCTSEILKSEVAWKKGSGVHMNTWAQISLASPTVLTSADILTWDGQRCSYDVQYSTDGSTWLTACSLTSTGSGTDVCSSGFPSNGISFLRVYKPSSTGCWPAHPADKSFRLTGVRLSGCQPQVPPTPAPPPPVTAPIPQEAAPIPQQSAPIPQQSAPANQQCYQENYGF